MANELTQLKKCFDAMELDCDDIESQDIIKQWLEKHDSKVGSRVAISPDELKSETIVPVTCATSGIKFSARCANAKTLEVALESARKAKLDWVARDVVEKIKALYKVAHSFERHAKLFATADATCYAHKRFEKCRGVSVTHSIEYLYKAAKGSNFHDTDTSFESVLVVQDELSTPLHLLPAWRFAEALASNCPLVLVVAATKCLPALVFSEICMAANLPDGLFSVLVMEPASIKKLECPSPETFLLSLAPNERHLSTSIIAEGADPHSAVNSAFELLADCWGMPNYFGVMLYVQDSQWKRVWRSLLEQAENVKMNKHNFAKTIDLVSENKVRVLKAAQVRLDEAAKQPTIFVQGFKTTKEVSSLVSTGPLHSDCLSIWTEYVSVALEISDLVSGYRTIWINGHNYFENDVENLKEVLCTSGGFDPSEKINRSSNAPVIDASEKHESSGAVAQTFLLYYGGAQKPAESNTFYPVYNRYPPFDQGDKVIAYVPAGGPKDVRNAVEAAAKAFPSWSKLTPLQRSKYMYKFAEVLSERAEGLQRKLSENTGHSDCAEELDNCIKAAFKWAGSCGTDAWSSSAPPKMKTLQSHRPHGVVGIACPHTRVMESLISLIVGAISNGNTAVLIVPEDYPLAPLTLTQVIEHCKIPAGVINLLTGPTEKLLIPLAGHHEVASLWCSANFRTPAVEEACESSRRRSVWWFKHSKKLPNAWEESEVEFHRSYKKSIWVPCSSVFAN